MHMTELTGYHDAGTVTTAARTLRGSCDGEVLVAGDPRYDAARLAWNRRVDPRPAVVVEADGPADVCAAVITAREHDLAFAVQATGHGTVLPADGGVLLKTSRMAAVEVDLDRRIARVGPGALWADVIAAAAPFGLAPISGMTPAVGVTGYTLGGGTGWLSRTYGFAADSVLRAEVVTADGGLCTASADEHPDLFWALRGGSGNFGAVTRLEFRLYPVARVYAGIAMFPAERARATLARYRDWALDEPDALHTAVMVMRVPAASQVPDALRGRQVLALRVFALCDPDDAQRVLAPLLAAAGPALIDGARTMTYAETGALSGPPPAPTAVRQHIDLFHERPDAVLDALVEATGDGAAVPLTAIELRHWGGAMARPAPDAGPAGHRDVPFSVIASAVHDGTHEPAALDAAVDDLAATLRPAATGGSFLNFLTDPARTATAFTAANHRRLAAVKRTWDPDNTFRHNHNVPPASDGTER